MWQGLDALMTALSIWNGGVILISHDEKFITTVAKEVGLPYSYDIMFRCLRLIALGLR